MDEPITVEKIETEINRLETLLSHVRHRIERLKSCDDYHGKDAHSIELSRRSANIEWEIGVLKRKMVEIKGEASTPC